MTPRLSEEEWRRLASENAPTVATLLKIYHEGERARAGEALLLEGCRRALRRLEALDELDDFINEHGALYKKLDAIVGR